MDPLKMKNTTAFSLTLPALQETHSHRPGLLWLIVQVHTLWQFHYRNNPIWICELQEILQSCNTTSKCRLHIHSLATGCYQHITAAPRPALQAEHSQFQTLFWRKAPQRQYLHWWAEAPCSPFPGCSPSPHTVSFSGADLPAQPPPTCTGLLCRQVRACLWVGAESSPEVVWRAGQWAAEVLMLQPVFGGQAASNTVFSASFQSVNKLLVVSILIIATHTSSLRVLAKADNPFESLTELSRPHPWDHSRSGCLGFLSNLL